MEEVETLRVFLAFKGQYHNHKETMAHAAMLLQIGFFAAMMRMKSCPPEWLNFPHICKGQLIVITFVSYLVVWGLITSYMEWQLRLRRIAANQVYELIEVIKNKSNEDLRQSIQKMQDVRGCTQRSIMGEWVVRTANLLILVATLLKIGFLC